jgi:hypothetical protein
MFKQSRFALLFGMAIILFTATGVFAQSSTGTWKAKKSAKNTEKIHISFSNETEKKNQMGNSIKFTRLQGLSYEQVNGKNSAVSFSIAAEAGNIDMTGTFTDGKGSGTFVFNANPNFTSAVEELGFKKLSTDKLFASTVLDVKLATVSDLRNSGIEIDGYDDVFKATIFKIDSTYIREMNDAGFANLEMEDLVKGRIFKIDAAFAREIFDMGFGGQSIEGLVKFRIFKITPEFLSRMRAEGFNDLTAEQAVKLRIFKIDSELIQKVRNSGNASPTIEELVEYRIFNGKKTETY